MCSTAADGSQLHCSYRAVNSRLTSPYRPAVGSSWTSHRSAISPPSRRSAIAHNRSDMGPPSVCHGPAIGPSSPNIGLTWTLGHAIGPSSVHHRVALTLPPEIGPPSACHRCDIRPPSSRYWCSVCCPSAAPGRRVSARAAVLVPGRLAVI